MSRVFPVLTMRIASRCKASRTGSSMGLQEISAFSSAMRKAGVPKRARRNSAAASPRTAMPRTNTEPILSAIWTRGMSRLLSCPDKSYTFLLWIACGCGKVGASIPRRPMRLSVCILALALSAAPAFAQQEPSEEQILRDLGMGGTFALGNLAVRDLQRGNDPVQQLKRFFSEARLPLSSAQQKQLTAVVDAQVKALTASGEDEDAARRINQEYTRKVNELLTPDQRAELRRYRTEQIMMRGGYQALRLIMENAQTPFTEEQEKQVQGIYIDFNRQLDQVLRDAKGKPNRAEMDKMENM